MSGQKVFNFVLFFDWVLPTLKTFDLGLKLPFHLLWKVSGGWWWVVGGGCTYDYSVSLSPNLWIMTFDLDLDLDLGLTIREIKRIWENPHACIFCVLKVWLVPEHDISYLFHMWKILSRVSHVNINIYIFLKYILKSNEHIKFFCIANTVQIQFLHSTGSFLLKNLKYVAQNPSKS